MPKRKRSEEQTLSSKLEKHYDEVFRALKTAKGFERQRLSKRQRDKDVTPDKLQRLDREVAVLKSLDLHQTARAHVSSSLLRVKSIAASPDLPEDIRAGVPRPDLPDDERAALHNVTSGLYNRKPVKEAVDRAIRTACTHLGVDLPGKGGSKKDKEPKDTKPKKPAAPAPPSDDSDGDDTDFEGFDDDAPQPGEDDDMDSAEEEAQMNRYDALLGSSDSEPDSDADDDDAFMSRYAQFRGTEKVNLDDISSASASEADDNMSDDDDEEDDQSDDEQTDLKGQSTSESEAEKPAPKKTKKQPPPPRDTTFLPSLMGGYVSGSESASDVDVAAPKKRRGQRQRQAIAEKKYGAAARHLAKQKRAKGRDAGWDPRRGAVDPDGGGTPWKRGVGNPFRRQHDHSQSQAPAPPPPKPTKKDDEGPLHPSWEARKKAKQSLKNVAYAGQKVVFD